MAMSTKAPGRRRQRAIMASDSEWGALGEAAAEAGMDRSSFVFERLVTLRTAPPVWLLDLVTRLERVERVERAVRVLYEVERHRLEANGESATWEALERLADEHLEAQARLG